jgi:hypothetical protein
VLVPAKAYDPRQALYVAFPKMGSLSKAVDPTMSAAEGELAQRERRGEDTSFGRAALDEAEWRIKCTNDNVAAANAVAKLTLALQSKDPPNAFMQDDQGSFAPGTEVWFIKLQCSTDQLLARQWPWIRQPIFLERINDPVRMVSYLEDHCWSDVARCGRDNRKELNEAISVIARVVMRGGQAGYLSAPGFIPAFEAFIRGWQDPNTGFFGMTYVQQDWQEVRTADLSLTFHIVRYVPHLIRWWPQLIDTLLEMRSRQYPQGWISGGKMTDHNNYDVVELFHRGWRHMRPDQRKLAAEAVEEMFDWCLHYSISPNGEISKPDQGDPIADSYYFAAAFLDTVGFFDTTKKFWTDKPLPNPTAIKSGMEAQLKKFNPYYTGVDDALSRLGGRLHPWTNAVL